MRTLSLAVQDFSGPNARLFSRERVIVLFWLGALAALLLMASSPTVGWDARVYGKAIQSLRHGVDPYAAGIAEQRAFQNHAHSSSEHAPFTYVYSPLTLLLLRLVAPLPDGLITALFLVALAAGFVLQLWAGFQLADVRERRWLAYLLPAVAFFPGLVTDDVILSGNISYVLYGIVLAAAVFGWKRERWFWFYVAVLAASAFKMQLLTLLAFPFLVGERQRLKSIGAAAAGLALFAAQARLWPELFREHLATIRIMFNIIPDFGYGPAGILGRFLWLQGRPFATATTVVYVVFAAVVGSALLYGANQARQWKISRELWVPLALVGTFLLNPRIMKYDMAAITIPMALLAWRGLKAVTQGAGGDVAVGTMGGSSRASLVFLAASFFLIPNLVTVFAPTWWPAELAVLLTAFALGVVSLRGQKLATVAEVEVRLDTEPFAIMAEPLAEPVVEVS